MLYWGRGRGRRKEGGGTEGRLTRALRGMGGWKWLQNSRSFFRKYWERRYSSAGERNSESLSATALEC